MRHRAALRRERDQEILDLARAGVSRPEIARRVGLTGTRVGQLLRGLELSQEGLDGTYTERCSACGQYIRARSLRDWLDLMKLSCPRCGRPGITVAASYPRQNT